MSKYSDYTTFNWSEPAAWVLDFNFSKIPDAPGFYIFSDFSGPLSPSSRPQRTVSYVGQTISLRRRLKQHFDGRGPAGSRISFQTVVWKSRGQQVYIRWSVDERASVERDLVNQLQAVHNDFLSEWS